MFIDLFSYTAPDTAEKVRRQEKETQRRHVAGALFQFLTFWLYNTATVWKSSPKNR